jgi:putative tricarboxylic transport membrane protein
MLEFLNVFHPADIGKGFVGVTAPFPLLLMFLGVIVASFFAAAPGIGGLLLLSLLMPYAMTLDPFAFIALIFGAATVGNTANTFTSVLIGVPGGSGSQATILDGYPLAKMGQANRALGAAFFGSLVGAFIGAFAFIISLPFFKPLVLSLGSPEFLMMCLLGLSAVAILGGKQPVRGLISATVGMAIALVGTDARTGMERFTFGISYLWDGVSLIIIAMGMFAVPEMVDIFRRKTSIAEMEPLKGGQLEGVKDVFRHWWLVVRSSIVGVWVGVLPGLGSSVADWFAYAHAMQTEKNTENFGKGDIRGVIAPESANNAKEGGDLIPTLLFGIPGGSSMAIILIGMTAVGIQPGTAILTHQAPYMYGTIWTLVIANTMATLLSMLFIKQFVKACMVPYYYMIPSVFLFCIVGAYGNELDMYDLIALLFFSALGIIMRRYGWPRPPLLVAVVLGAQVQQYLWLSVDRYGLEWMLFPSVIFLFLLIVATVAYPFIRNWLQSRKMMDMDVLHELTRSQEKGSLVMCLFLVALFVGMIIMGQRWPLRASLPVYFIAALGLFLTAIQILRDILAMRQMRLAGLTPSPFTRQENLLEFNAWLWLAGLALSCYVIGFHITFLIYPLLFGYLYGPSLRNSLYISISGVLLVFIIFDYFVGTVWPNPIDDFIGDTLVAGWNAAADLFRR